MSHYNSRIIWIDWMKFIGIALVVMGHLSFTNIFINQFIYSFHMPLFFIIAGFLFNYTDNYLIKNIKNLILPYLIYCCINYAWWFIFSYIRHPEIYEHSFENAVIKPVLGILIAVDYKTPISFPIPGALWFLIAMFWVRTFYSLIVDKFGEYKSIVISIILCLMLMAIYLLKKNNLDLLFSLDSSILAFPFFIFGIILKKNIIFDCNKIIILIVLIISIITTYFLTTINGAVDMNTFNFGKNIFLYFLNGIIGCVIIFAIAYLLKNIVNKFVVEISFGTIIIIGLHGIITNGILNWGIKFMFGESQILYSCIQGVLVSILSICLFYYPIHFF